jgi:hypothetical protein
LIEERENIFRDIMTGDEFGSFSIIQMTPLGLALEMNFLDRSSHRLKPKSA